MTKPDLIKSRDLALDKCLGFIRQDNFTMAQACFDRANRLWPVTDQQIQQIQQALIDNNSDNLLQIRTKLTYQNAH